MELTLDEIVANLEKRDRIDTTRKESPLLKAPDAIVVDTSHLTFEQQVDKVVEVAKDRIAEKP
jgi:cytidylate kinase